MLHKHQLKVLGLILAGLLIGLLSVRAQNATDLSKITESIDEAGWLHIREDVALSAESFWENHGAELGLGAEDEMRLMKSQTDELGLEHLRYQQYHAGHKVEGAEYSLHLRDGNVYLAHGSIGRAFSEGVNPNLSESEAMELAKNQLGGKIYAWEDEEWEQAIRMEKGESATWLPKGELRYVQNHSMAEEDYILSWYFEISMLDPFEDYAVAIDANSGKLVAQTALFYGCFGTDAASTANTLYNGTQAFTSVDRGPNLVLEDCGRDVETRIFQGRINFSGAWVPRSWSGMTRVFNNNPFWWNTNRTETSAHWAAQEAWDYFENAFGYTGWDGSGRRVRLATQFRYVNGNLSNNAAYHVTKEMMLFGANTDVTPTRHRVSLDLVGHEYTHGVIENTAGFQYQRESGALSEGYADIFGFLIERAAQNGFNLDWWISEDDLMFSRHMENPLSTNQPNVVWGGFYVNPTPGGCPFPQPFNDFCGVHINCSIITKAFNLVAGSNIQQNNIFTPGIGIDPAAAIAFRALRYYSHETDGFADARAAWMQAAADLYGSCSAERHAVANAWASVGVGTAFNNNAICTNINGPNLIQDCWWTPAQNFYYTTQSYAGANISWNVPWGLTYYTSGSNNQHLVVTGIVSGFQGGNISASSNWNGQLSGHDNFYVIVDDCSQFRQSSPDEQAKLFELIGNPVQDKVRMQLLQPKISLKLIDMQGKVLRQMEADASSLKMDVSAIAAGYYLLQAESQGQTQVERLIILR
ncbi:MAG: M4 family metallopeptidase [Bacteroidota bacterium]